MKNDVQTLIAALTTERNSLDRAIVALQAISGNGAQTAPTVVTAKKPATRRVRAFRSVPDAARRDIVERMIAAKAQGGNLARLGAQLGRLHGISPATVKSGWGLWRQQFDRQRSNAQDVSVVEPELTTV